MIYTTLAKIKGHGPCIEGWRKLLKHLGKITADDEPLALSVILESNGLDDLLWCLRTVPEENNRWRLLAVAFARKVQHLMTDPRSVAALDVTERHAHGLATDDELDAARAVARAVARAAAEGAAWDAAWAAAWAAATRDAAWAAATWAAAGAAGAAGAAARAASRDAQALMFLDAINHA